jgi:signal peptidase II
MKYLNFLGYIFIVFLLIVLDQYTKNLAVNGFHLKLNDYIKFTLVYNEGSAFGIKLFNNETYIIIGSIVCIFLVYFFFKFNKKIYHLADNQKNKFLINLFNFSILFIISGTLGNLIDRIKYSKVVDWISLLNLPIFNLADSYITIGVILFIYSYSKLEI